MAPEAASGRRVYFPAMPSLLDEAPARLYAGDDPPPAPPAPPDDPGGGGDDGRRDDPDGPRGWVTIASFLHPTQAHIARLRLEGAGIACVLVGELTAATQVLAIAGGGVKLQVPRQQQAWALRLLRKTADRPEPRVALADFERILHAKSAACVVEAVGLWCDVIERRTTAAPPWSRWLPAGWRARLWPAASVVVERDDLVASAAALSRTPFRVGLTQSARSAAARCGSCSAGADWAVWQLHWPQRSPNMTPGAPVPIRRLPRLIRRCGRCGEPWRA